MNFLVSRTISFAMALAFLAYYTFNFEEGYFLLLGAFIFEGLVVFFINKDYSVRTLNAIGSPHNFLIVLIVSLYVLFASIGIFFEDLIPGTLIDWSFLWAFIGLRVYQDYKLVVTYQERLNHVLVPFGFGLIAASIAQRIIADGLPQGETILQSEHAFWVIVFFLVREFVDWFYDIARYVLSRPL